MSHANHDPVAQTRALARNRSEQFRPWLEQLRRDDPAFAEVSSLYPEDVSEWQAAVYLLTGCDVVWAATRTVVLAQRSIGSVIRELQDPRRPWASSEEAVMQWAAHFWDVHRRPATFPYAFEDFYFRRWITASHLYKKIPPALTTPWAGR